MHFHFVYVTIILQSYCYSEMHLNKNSTLLEIDKKASFVSGSCNPQEMCPLKKSRKKRFIYFPNGSNFVATLSTVKALPGAVPRGWNLVLEFDVIYHLPTEREFFKKIKHSTLRKRQRRQLWTEIEKSLEYHSLDGEACIIKAICESERDLLPKGQSMVHDIIRVIFRVVDVDDDAYERAEKFQRKSNSDNYRDAFEEGRCGQYLTEEKCPISLIDILLSFTQNGNNFSML